ncbi:hydroxymethylglutaryl-CoA lyase [Maritalea sp.]|uniref:hydroxymethylglutaryl-CoA lyase n=1 Tax=Maritalea sp. TaxID=2003361 RepID=UPI003EFB1C2C
MTDHVTIFEVGPRDGLQNEKQHIATTDKIKLINLLSDCGFSKIEATSFVSPKWVPQMADALEVLGGIDRHDDIAYAALTPNLRGYEGARAANADEVAIFASASEGFSQKNINCSIEESIERFNPLLEAAKEDGIPVRGYVSCITDCPYDGPTSPEAVAKVAEQLFDLGCYEISLGDTIGAATPETTSKMLEAALRRVPVRNLAGHFHDTKGNAIYNIETCLGYGLRTFDAAVGGLGGCPYAPGAKGNVATERVVQMLQGKGFDTGIDVVKLSEASTFATSLKG